MNYPHKSRSTLFRLGLHLLKVIPFPPTAVRWLIRLCLAIIVGKTPEKALTTLFLIENDLSTMIDRAAIQYGQGVHIKQELMGYHDFFIDRIKPGEKVLDIGCGNGALSNDMVQKSKAIVTGIDRVQKNIDNCRSLYHHPSLRFIYIDATRYLPDSDFDVIVMSNVLEHIENRRLFIINLLEKYQPSRLLIRVPMINRSWYAPMRKKLGLPYFSDNTHFIEYTVEVFMGEMEEFGLKICHYQINWGEIWAEVKV